MKSRLFRSVIGILAGIGLLVSVMAFLPAVSQASEYRLEDFLILVEDQLIIRGYADVICCGGGIGAGGIPRRSDLGSRNYAEIGGKGWTRIPTVAPIVKDVAVIATNVKLGNYARLSHVIYDGVGGRLQTLGGSAGLAPRLRIPT